MTEIMTGVRDCTTCKHHRHLTWLDEHLCGLPSMDGPIDREDVHNEGCPEWTPMEVNA